MSLSFKVGDVARAKGNKRSFYETSTGGESHVEEGVTYVVKDADPVNSEHPQMIKVFTGQENEGWFYCTEFEKVEHLASQECWICGQCGESSIRQATITVSDIEGLRGISVRHSLCWHCMDKLVNPLTRPNRFCLIN